jgi:hexaprenyl-diphosphate synthase
MIHVASLLHDDVIDVSPTRRGAPSAPALFGNKVSILAGDFLLGRASGSLARLGSSEVVELMSAVIANLVEGEVMQLKATTEPERRPTKDGFDAYMQKTYLKTASLMAKGSRSAVVLGGCEDEGIKDAAYAYGRNLGIAFQVRAVNLFVLPLHLFKLITMSTLSQLVDDLLDFTPTPSLTLGKPSAGFDLSLGLATAPLLYAWESNPSLTPLILRRFDQPGDVETARDLVLASDGMDRTRALARTYAEAARDIVRERLPESDARAGLEGLTEEVLRRLK